MFEREVSHRCHRGRTPRQKERRSPGPAQARRCCLRGRVARGVLVTSRARKREDPTLKICVVGDSHVACLKKAWDEISAGHKGVAFTFFAARGNKLGGL